MVAGVVGGLVVGAGMTLGTAAPAAAKGSPEEVTIARPGDEAVALVPTTRGGSTAITRLAEDLGLLSVTDTGFALLAVPPTQDLGQALTIEWTMYNPMPADPEAAPRVVQSLYLHAAGGPLVHTVGGQRMFGQVVTRPGWHRAPPRLTASLAALGVVNEVRLPDPAPALEPTPPADAAPAGASAAGPAAADRSTAVPALPVAGGLAAAAGLVVGRVILGRGTGAAA